MHRDGTGKTRQDAKKTPNESNHLLVKANKMPFTGNEYSQMLMNFFKEKVRKSIGTTLLRKVYLSKYSDVLSDMKTDAAQMGHSVSIQHEVYTPNA